MILEKELETFDRELPRLLAEAPGKFALIHGDKVIETFDTYEDALKAGYHRFQLEPFMVRQITDVPQEQFYTRHLSLCPR